MLIQVRRDNDFPIVKNELLKRGKPILYEDRENRIVITEAGSEDVVIEIWEDLDIAMEAGSTLWSMPGYQLKLF